MHRIKIMIASSQYSFRIAVRQIISRDTVFEAIELLECDPGDDGDNAIAEIEANSPDIVLLEMAYPFFNKLYLGKRIVGTFPQTAVVALSDRPEEDDNELFEAVKSGATAYLRGKQPGGAELVKTIKQISRGECPIIEKVIDNPKVAWRILEQLQEMVSMLGAREVVFQFNLDLEEFQVLQLIAKGNQKKQIARILGISELTINKRVSSTLFKLNSNEKTLDTFTRVRASLLSVRLARDGNLFILNDSPASRPPQLLHDSALHQ